MQQYIFQDELQQTPAPQPLRFGVTHGRAGDRSRSAPRRRRSAFCRASPISTIGGARDFPSPAPAPTSPRCKTAAEARRRSLHRQRAEDMDDARAARRLDLLPGAHRSAGQEAGGHFLPADRHEDAGHHGAPDHHDRRRRTRSTRSSSTTCACRPRICVGEENKGWDYAKYPARPRAHRDRASRPLEGAHPPHQGAARRWSAPATRR